MTSILKISEAASLGLHSAVYLAKNTDRLVSTKEIATELKISENHLSKVMQRLVGAGYVKSIRGPKGGFQLSKPKSKITLKNIFEAIQGSIKLDNCLLGKPVCDGETCILGSLVSKVNKEVIDYLSSTKLSNLAI